MSSIGAAPRAAVSVSNARAEASRRNGAKSCGPRTPEGKARAAQNALKHGLRAQQHVVLADEDGAEFAGLEAALVAELAPAGALQEVLARRVAVAAWRLMRADRLEAELFAERALWRRGRRARPDPRRQRHALVRDAPALPRRRHGRVLARAAHPQGAPGRGLRRPRDRSRGPTTAPARNRGGGAARPARRARDDAERTRDPRQPARSGQPRERASASGVPWLSDPMPTRGLLSLLPLPLSSALALRPPATAPELPSAAGLAPALRDAPGPARSP